MQDIKEVLRERMGSLSDESLIRIVTEEAEEYEAEALQAAHDELSARSIDVDNFLKQKKLDSIFDGTGIQTEGLVSIYSLIHSVDYSLMEKTLYELYPEENQFSEEYGDFFSRLLQIEPSTESNILIKLDKQESDADNPNTVNWAICGLDISTGTKLNPETFAWNEWPGFYVLDEDLKVIGPETFVALCVYTMTINGFTKEEAEVNLKIKEDQEALNEYIYRRPLNPSEYMSHNIFSTALEFQKKNATGEVPQIRPWIRLWARSLDSLIISLLLLIVTKFIARMDFNLTLLGLPLYPLFIVIYDSFLLHLLGTTPGKWLLGIKISNTDGSMLSLKKAFKRSIMVWLFAEAIGMNSALTTFTYLVSYFRLTYMGKTYWDDKNQCIVVHEKIGVVKCIIFIAVLITIVCLASFIALQKIYHS